MAAQAAQLGQEGAEAVNQETRRPMHIRDFGDALIATGDLDPVYIAIHHAHLPEPQLCRLLLSYWFFYHLGAAAWLSEQEGSAFWNWVAVAAVNEDGAPQRPPVAGRWPRAAERRHFRGAKCVSAVRWFAQKEPEHWVRSLIAYDTHNRTDVWVMQEVQRWPMFGSWVAFKAADMLERCAGAGIRFSASTVLLYEAPAAALDLLVAGTLDEKDHTKEWWYNRLLEYFSARRAPPGLERFCGPAEVETVLCKWASHVGGHYSVGKDIHEVRGMLTGWGETADKLLQVAPQEIAT